MGIRSLKPQNDGYLLRYLVLLIMVISSQTYELSAKSIFSKHIPNKIPKISKKSVDIHPFFKNIYFPTLIKPHESFALTQDEIVFQVQQFKEDALATLNSVIDHPHIRIQTRPLGISPFALSEGLSDESVLKVDYTFKGISICDLELKIINLGGQGMFMGDTPDIDEKEDRDVNDWPTKEDSVDILRRYLFQLNVDENSLNILNYSQCFLSSERSLIPVWKIIFKSEESLSYEVLVDNEDVYKVKNLFFDLEVDGKIQAYTSNPTNSELQIFTTKLQGNTTLSSGFFTTNVTTTLDKSIVRATSDIHEFIYDPSDFRFMEASAFIHATHMHEYFQSLGYDWVERRPMILKLHALVNNTKNNALYQPPESSSSGQPSIFIGDGDGKVLQNLSVDSDVVSHEFGHHVIYRNIKETSGESLVLHEGLADYFTYSKNNDSCLGESICVAGKENSCVIYGKCLRTGNNKLTYDGDNYSHLEAHQKGQLISAFLLDLHNLIDKEVVPKIAYNSLNYLISNSGIKHFLIALMMADLKNKGNNTCTIYEAALSRGFGDLLADIDCLNPEKLSTVLSDVNAKLSNPSGSNSTQETTKDDTPKKKNPFGCGSLSSGPPSSGNGPWILWLLLGLPLLIPIYRSLLNLRLRLSQGFRTHL